MAGKAKTGEVVKRGFGRPTKVTPELISKAWEYVRQTGEFSYQLVPTIEGLSLAIKVDRTTIYDWEKNDANAEFSNIVKELRASQAEKLIQNALLGRYNPMIAKLMLSKHGYVERTETDVTSAGEKLGANIEPDQATQLIRARAERTNI